MNRHSVVIVGSPHRRAELKRWLGGRGDIRLDGEIGEAHALRLIERLAPDIVVLDCAAPTINGLVALQWLRALPVAPRILALGATGSAAERRLLQELGADAYALPDSPTSVTHALATLLTPEPTVPLRTRAA